MFARLDGTIDHALEREREACRRRLGQIREQTARLAQEVTELVRAADDRRDWQAAGCASSAQWLAQIYRSDYRTAQRITRTSDALRKLPALDHALSLGDLTLDQVAAAAPLATPETDAQLARIAVGKAPSEIEVAARTLAPPVVADDQALYQRRALRMTWTNGKRELRFNGSLPLEQGVAFEQAIWSIAKPLRAADKKAGTPVLEWQQYTADALVTLATQPSSGDDGVRRSPTTQIVHLSADEPPFLEGAGPISPETAERLCCDARRLTIKPCGSDLVHSRITRCASYPQMRALIKRSEALPIPRLQRHPRTPRPPHHPGQRRRQGRARQPHPALPPPPHAAPRPPHHRQRPRQESRLHRRQRPRHHRQPATRTTPLTGFDRARCSGAQAPGTVSGFIRLPSANSAERQASPESATTGASG